MSLHARVTAILAAPRPGASPRVRTSAAFAARFEAEARRSGLTVDLEEKDAEQLMRVCSTCGAQNARHAISCFNCQSELLTSARTSVALKRRLPEARWLLVVSTTGISQLPLLKVPWTRERFSPPPPGAPVTGRQVLSRFLSVFVQPDSGVPPPGRAGRFRQSTFLDKFLSVFVERK